ncbi:aspartate ammonia-lyase [Candidatus Gracilibacteria bacterium]|nr:aspartate ammonia-lyase [Candidatus Gracilibacteria bacterium]
MKRTEKDSLGKIKVDKKAYHGAFTVRATNNFQISGEKAPDIFREALGIVKLAAMQSNASLNLIPAKHAKAAEKATIDFMKGKFPFDLDIFQAGAGTSYNMNANEVIANRANEILKKPKGSYSPLHPNNHINMGRSTNDVIPTATRIATLLSLPALLHAIKELENSLEKIATKHKKTIKVGRTHTQDAVPISLGQEFDSFAQALRKSREFIIRESQELQILGIGGTAVGTGITAHPKYKAKMIKNLSALTGIKFTSAKNLTEISNNMNSFMNFSASLRSLAVNLLNLCQNLRLMSMGPKARLQEITLPPVQAGSSIMPGKINPSIPEAVEMVAMQVLGNDTTIQTACHKSQFELNVFCPLIMANLLKSMQILSNATTTLNKKCIKGLKINTSHISELFDNSLCTATELAPKLGYELTADIVKTALKKGITIKEEIANRGL